MKKRIFVVLPFQEGPLSVYNELKKRLGERFEVSHSGDLDNSQSILKDIIQSIVNADFILVDLTGDNPNVYYELGIAHALNKNTIIITQSIDSLPFDIRSYRVIPYSMTFNKIDELFTVLDRCLEEAADGKVSFGNPVRDYAPSVSVVYRKEEDVDGVADMGEGECAGVEAQSLVEQVDEVIGDSAKGVLDAMDELDDAIRLFGDQYREMEKDVDKMNLDINKSADRMISFDNNVPNAINLKRLECRKAAKVVNGFSKSFSNHIDMVGNEWDRIEDNMLFLIDNQKMRDLGRLDDLNTAVDALSGLGEQIRLSCKGTDELAAVVQGVRGMERLLTSAIDSLLYQLNRYSNLS